MNKTLTKEGLEYIASRVKTAGTLKDVKVDGSSVVTDGIASIDLTGKQDLIDDLATIREGAEKGATALQEVPADYRTSAAQDLIDAEKASKEELSAVEEKIPSIEGLATEQWVEDKGYLTEHQSLAAYRTSEDQDAIDAEKADKSSVYTKEEVDEKLDEAGKITDVTINGESVVADKVAEIALKTIGGEAITGDGDIAVNAMSVVEILPTEPSETTLYKLTKDQTHQETKIVIDPTTGEEIEVQVTIVDFAKGLYIWLDDAWKSVLADSTAVNYETLINKPRINGKILTGNRSSSDLGLVTEENLAKYQEKESDDLETTSKDIVGAINEIKSATSTVYKYKGSVESIDDLPTRASVGDSYYVEDEQSTYAYNGEAFLSIGGTADLSSYQKRTDSTLKTTAKTVSGAINEVRTTAQANKGAIEEIQLLIGEEPLETEAQTITEAINEIAKGGGGSGSMTLNGEETEVTSEKVNIYAPLAAGEKGRVLVSQGEGAPVWQAFSGIPTGIIMPFAGLVFPDGWLLCDGRAVSRTDYADLFAVIGTLYGEGDKVTTFNLPNLVGRFLEGAVQTTTGHTLGSSVNAALPTPALETNTQTHSHSFSGTRAQTESGGSHYHSWSQKTTNKSGTDTQTVFSSSENRGSATLTTNTTGAHQHYYTPSGSITGNGSHSHTVSLSASNTIYGKSTTVQPASVCVNYLIRY